MSAKNPKELKQMVAASQQDMDQMQTALNKLHHLSPEDKTEAALLRSRIEEQSSLIMMLKKRADETTEKNKVLEKIRDELENFRSHAQHEIDMELKKHRMLEDRFNDLAENHTQMIQFKDQYKQMNEELRRENDRLQQENKKLFSKDIEERNTRISNLEQSLLEFKQSSVALETRHKSSQSALEEKFRNLQDELGKRDHELSAEIKGLQAKLRETEERLKGTGAKLKYELDTKVNVDSETILKIDQLKKEKDEMLELAMQRGKLVAEKVSDNKRLLKKVDEMEKTVRDMQDKFEREAATVNANLQVRKLRNELDITSKTMHDMENKFGAYKKHANKLLEQEKELNQRLRHLTG